MNFSLGSSVPSRATSASVFENSGPHAARRDVEQEEQGEREEEERIIPLPKKLRELRNEDELQLKVEHAPLPEVELKPGLVLMPAVEKTRALYASDVPLLLLNKGEAGNQQGQGEKERFQNDLVQRPEACGEEGYSAMPVELFGKALLKGMGWDEGGAIGVGRNAAVVAPIEYIARPRGLGLGSTPKVLEEATGEEGEEGGDEAAKGKRGKKKRRKDRPLLEAAPDKDGRKRHYREVGEELREVKALRMAPTALVGFVGGSHEGVLGRVEAVDTRRVSVKLGSGAVVSASRDELVLLDAHLLTLGDAGMKRIKRIMKKARKEVKKGAKSKKKRRKKSPDWLRPGIVVRCAKKGSSLYQKKLIVVDMTSPTSASCVLLDQPDRIVDDVQQSDVQTALPKAGGRVLVVRGEHTGNHAVLQERNSKANKVVVQLEDSLELLTLTFEDVAQAAKF